MVPVASGDHMAQTVKFQEILRRLAIVDEGFVDDQAGLGLGLHGAWVLDHETVALVRVGALAAIGSPEVCLEWSATPALAANATEAEITGVLLAIAPVKIMVDAVRRGRTQIRQALGVLDAAILGEPGVLQARQRLALRVRSARRR